jgi:predicted GNAT superfamily acetyltransferase
MDETQICRAEANDLDAIRALTAEGYPGVSLFEPNELEWAMEHAAGVWVAASNENVIAYLIAFADDAAYDGEEFHWFQVTVNSFLYIDRVAVTANARRGGIGAQLYSFVETFAREHKVANLVCEVNLQPPNPTSRAFHAKQGFQELATLDTRDGRTAALLQKRLV